MQLAEGSRLTLQRSRHGTADLPELAAIFCRGVRIQPAALSELTLASDRPHSIRHHCTGAGCGGLESAAEEPQQ